MASGTSVYAHLAQVIYRISTEGLANHKATYD